MNKQRRKTTGGLRTPDQPALYDEIDNLRERVKELEAENAALEKRLLDACMSNHAADQRSIQGTSEVTELEEEKAALKSAIGAALSWRNMDGDGISDPIRQLLIYAAKGGGG